MKRIVLLLTVAGTLAASPSYGSFHADLGCVGNTPLGCVARMTLSGPVNPRPVHAEWHETLATADLHFFWEDSAGQLVGWWTCRALGLPDPTRPPICQVKELAQDYVEGEQTLYIIDESRFPERMTSFATFCSAPDCTYHGILRFRP